MKRSLRTALALATLLFAVFLLAACGGTDPADTTAPATSAPVTTVPVEPITFATLQEQGEGAYGITLPNATVEFSFRDEVTEASGVSYTVSRDQYGENPIAAKIVPLNEGNNVFYLHVEDGDDYFMLTVTLYRRPMHTVTFDLMDGAAPVTQSVEEGSLATPPTIPYPEEFLGWDKDVTAPITAPTSFIGSWREYTVSYVVGDAAANHEDNPASYTAFGTALYAPTRLGYTFLGWTLNGETVTAIPAGTTGAVTLTAAWEIVEYPITYVLGDGAENNALNPTEYTVLGAALGAPTRLGYTF